jgi:hypothetical protein
MISAPRLLTQLIALFAQSDQRNQANFSPSAVHDLSQIKLAFTLNSHSLASLPVSSL